MIELYDLTCKYISHIIEILNKDKKYEVICVVYEMV